MAIVQQCYYPCHCITGATAWYGNMLGETSWPDYWPDLLKRWWVKWGLKLRPFFFFFPSCIFVNLQKVANLNSFEICNLLIICIVQLNLHVCCHLANSSRQKWETHPIKPESWRTSLILTLTEFSPTSHSFQSCFE